MKPSESEISQNFKKVLAEFDKQFTEYSLHAKPTPKMKELKEFENQDGQSDVDD